MSTHHATGTKIHKYNAATNNPFHQSPTVLNITTVNPATKAVAVTHPKVYVIR